MIHTPSSPAKFNRFLIHLILLVPTRAHTGDTIILCESLNHGSAPPIPCRIRAQGV